jgi:two-component system response regulator HydG
MARRLMVVDDDADLRSVIATFLEEKGYEVEEAGDGAEALGRLSTFEPDLILTDVRMPGMDGLALLGAVKERAPGVDVLVTTGHGDMESAVVAMREGALDYLVKPVGLKDLEARLAQAFKTREASRKAGRTPDADDGAPLRPGNVIGRDPRMIEVFKLIGVLARNRASVLIRGETGTGKEVVARAIHEHSAYREEPFLAVNCTALTATLLESELFGHARGAFTGAVGSRKGYFELAGSGTIFLDEIGDTSPEFQAKLLRVLQERTFYPVGGEQPRTTEARVIAATHQPLEELVRRGRFREDLLYRLKVVEVELPPLRDRPGDIPLLAEHLLRVRRADLGTGRLSVSPSAMRRLEAHDWPGNVRELENALTRAAVLARGGVIGEEHLRLWSPPAVATTGPGSPEVRTLGEAIAAHVQRTLRETAGNRSEAARILGISRSRLARLIEKHGLEVPGD